MNAQGDSIERWRTALLALEDSVFFDLLRGHLGNIQSPYNKQRLLDDLTAFLSRRENVQTIASYLDERDSLVLAAIDCLNEPTPQELSSFLDGELSYTELHDTLLNLEERLLIYRYPDGDERRMASCPIVSTRLYPQYVRSAPLFPTQALAETAQAASGGIVHGVLLMAALSFAASRGSVFKADGSVRKRIAREAEAIFGPDRFERCIAALLTLGLARERDGSYQVDERRIARFAALGLEDARAYLGAALCLSDLDPMRAEGEADTDEALPLASGRARREQGALWARLFKSLLARLDAARAYPETTLLRLLDVTERALLRHQRRKWDSLTETRRSLYGRADPVLFRKAALRALVDTGALTQISERLFALAPAGPGEGLRAKISVDASFAVTVLPGLSVEDAYALTRFLEILEAGQVLRCRLTRESAGRAFNDGLSAADLAQTLERFSGTKLTQNLRFSLADWEQRHSSVALYSGEILTLGENQRHLVQNPQVLALIRRELAPGVYLLKREATTDIVELLAKSGADYVSMPRDEDDQEGVGDPRPSAFAPLEADASCSHPSTTENLSDAPINPGEGEARLEQLRRALAERKLPKEQAEELAARIDRKLILQENQLVGSAVRYEKLEAKGLDYVGKVRVVEQSIKHGSMIEISWKNSDGASSGAMGHPVALEKNSGEVDLVLDQVPRGGRLKISLGKIALVRRVKRSIFGE